ncbi:unnamed protein product [Boreogadus saida]
MGALLLLLMGVADAIRCQDPNEPNFKEWLPSTWDGEYIQYRCREGFTPTDRGWATCTETGWTPNPLCEAIRCQDPNDPNFKEWLPSTWDGEYKQYRCREGFTPTDRGRATCTETGWTPNPLCKGVTCKLPQLNGNTYPDVNKVRFLPGETVLVKCEQGRWFSYDDQQTQKTITCTESGQWDSAAICQEIKCQDPNDPNLKERLESKWMDGYARYQCIEGLTPTDAVWARCTENGWTPNPLCEVIPPCNIPTRVENADITENQRVVYNHGAAVTYECRTNYRMEGERTITCQWGHWSPRTPTCIMIPPCYLPTTVENADIIGKKQVYNHGAAVTYACHNNYRMKGERTIRCQSGQWSSRTPTCIKVICRLPQLNGNTYLDVNKDRYLPGETVLVKCNRDRCFSYDDQQTQKTITCTGSGEWDTAAKCQEIRCQDPNDPNLEGRLPSRRMGGSARYRCREGFTPTDGGRARCTENGWAPNPLCEVIPPCNKPTRVENADITERIQEVYNHGAAVTYACRTNYRMEGERTMTCRMGQWSPRTPTCIVIPPCNLPTTVENADIIEKKQEVYNHGAAVTYACRTNYRMKGERTITCRSGHWSPRTPICISEEICDATQPNITTQCFGSLGGTVKVQLPALTSQDDKYTLKKNDALILSDRIQTTNIQYSFNVSTGIFAIKDIDWSDNGTYSMEVHDETGREVAYTKCNLTIQAPVSSPLLSRECLSRGQQRVSCSAGGDGLHYSWSLDGLPLNDPRLLSGPSSASDVTLEPGRSGLLSCSVRNNVSHATANVTLSECDGFIYVNCTSNGTHISQWVHRDNNTLCPETAVGSFNFNITGLIPFIARSLTVVLLLLAALGVYWALKKKKTSRPRDMALSSMAVDDGVPYGNVSGATGRAGGE